MGTSEVAVIVATRNRADLLAPMLRTLDEAVGAASTPCEVIVVDNGSTDDTASVLRQWISAGSGRSSLRVDQPGKARALNGALALASSPLIAFTDDDVALPPDWLRELLRFCAEHPEFDAGTGRVLLPPDTPADVQARVAHYRTLPLYDKGDLVRDVTLLYGCNMFVRRRAFERVGLFNERLGPGASGLHEDGELARRLCDAGMRVGYMPRAVVYHLALPERLTRGFLFELCVRDARSRFIMEPAMPWGRALSHLVGAYAVAFWWLVMRNQARYLRACGRIVLYRELLRLIHNRRQQSTNAASPECSR